MHVSSIPSPRPSEKHDVVVPIGRVRLEGDLVVPEHARGVVVFAQGGGSSRKSPGSGFVATWLNDEARAATLLVDLLAPEEAHVGELKFDIPFLAERLRAIRVWLSRDARTRELPVGYFGASTGAAAALLAAATQPDVAAIVSRGGRPDLAGADALGRVKAATLLLVGEHDRTTLELNRAAQRHLRWENTLAIVQGASHRFDEPGVLLDVAGKAALWFRTFLSARATRERARPQAQ
jgi:putative phosphoribosyl transferase